MRSFELTTDNSHRRSIRLHDYDYTRDGIYFVTVCSHHHECLFGDVVDGEMKLNRWGEIVREYWEGIPQHFEGVELDEYIIMPNHVHGIIVINRWEQTNPTSKSVGIHTRSANVVGAQHAAPLRDTNRVGAETISHPRVLLGSLGAIVRSFKSAATKRINAQRGISGMTVWQRNYYEHIIRDAESLDSTRLYIQTNPTQWDADSETPTKVSV